MLLLGGLLVLVCMPNNRSPDMAQDQSLKKLAMFEVLV
jgi:hypothetical protein